MNVYGIVNDNGSYKVIHHWFATLGVKSTDNRNIDPSPDTNAASYDILGTNGIGATLPNENINTVCILCIN